MAVVTEGNAVLGLDGLPRLRLRSRLARRCSCRRLEVGGWGVRADQGSRLTIRMREVVAQTRSGKQSPPKTVKPGGGGESGDPKDIDAGMRGCILSLAYRSCEGARPGRPHGKHERVSQPVRGVDGWTGGGGQSMLDDQESGARVNARELEIRVPGERRVEILPLRVPTPPPLKWPR